MRLYWYGFVSIFALFSCRLAPSEPNVYQKNGLYPQDFVSPVAVSIRERNGEPFYVASASLMDRKLGIFATAKHFVEDVGGEDFKIFFNGRVYTGGVAATPAISDLALLGAGGIHNFGRPLFNPADFPDPLTLAEDQLLVGASVRVLGMHPHPIELQANKILIGIFRGYYDMPWLKKEFVFEELEAKVSNLAVEVRNKDIAGTPKGAGFISNTYIEIITTEDHHFSFGGLSGGPVVNEKNEVVGVVAHGQEGGNFLVGLEVIYKPWNTLRIVPVKELKKLLNILLFDEK